MIYLLCGVPGSGKTWVAKQLSGFQWVPHDDHKIEDYPKVLIKAEKSASKPILAEAPFRITDLIAQLKKANISVKTFYVTAPDKVIRDRYQARDKRPYPKQHASRLRTYDSRKWDFRGTSAQVLEELERVGT